MSSKPYDNRDFDDNIMFLILQYIAKILSSILITLTNTVRGILLYYCPDLIAP